MLLFFILFIRDGEAVSEKGMLSPVRSPLEAIIWSKKGGTPIRLSALRGDTKILVLIFASSNCPITSLYWDRLKGFRNTYQPKGVTLIVVGGNSDDSTESLLEILEEKDFEVPVVWDEGHALAKSFGVDATPLVVVIGEKGSLLYRGRFDDSWRDEKQVKTHYLEEAIHAAQQGKKSKDHLEMELFSGSRLR